jgi:hypothetical protein
MSDGHHRCLPMRRAWQRLAERADKRAYMAEEISDALAPALEQDCRDELASEFLSGLRCVIEESSLFRDDMAARLQVLRPEAGIGLGRAFLDNVSLLSAADHEGIAVVQQALKSALVDRANRGARQVEEHYLRESSAPRANNVRRRLEDGIGCTDFDAIVTRVLSVDPKRAPNAPVKKKGLDDGVSLR